MTTPCPSCGGNHVMAVAEHYDIQVRKADADPGALAPLAPPIRRTILPGTLCITLFWIAVLSPGFVAPERAVTVASTMAALGVVSLLVWLRARKTDRVAMSTYQARRICGDCGWMG